MNEKHQDFDPKRSRWIPWAIVGFFGVVIAVNAVMLWFALGTFNGLSYKQAYDRGLHYNETLAAADAQAALGWHVGFAFEPLGERRGVLHLRLLDKAEMPIGGAVIEGVLVRPVQAGEDLPLRISERGGGLYEAEITAPLPGLWEVDLFIDANGQIYRVQERIEVR